MANLKLQMSKNYLKIVLIGESAVGKTCLCSRYFHGKFFENWRQTMTPGFFSKNISIEGRRFELGAWDTAGSERYASVAGMFYREAIAAILCYDVRDFKTFQKLDYWLSQLRKYNDSCRVYIAATKTDLLQSYREAIPDLNVAEKYARDLECKFFLTSSKSGENVVELFKEVVEDYIAHATLTSTGNSDTILLSSSGSHAPLKNSSKCCARTTEKIPETSTFYI